jgi:hypothetical protein
MKKAAKDFQSGEHSPSDPTAKFLKPALLERFKSEGVYKPSELLKGNRTRWLRVGDLPWSRGTTYRLISEDAFLSVILQLPGSGRKIRLVDAESLDAYFLRLAETQRRERKTKRAATEA